jgi:hypothetical protein
VLGFTAHRAGLRCSTGRWFVLIPDSWYLMPMISLEDYPWNESSRPAAAKTDFELYETTPFRTA